MYFRRSFSPGGALNAVSRHAAKARQGSMRQLAAKSLRRRRVRGVPSRGRMVRQVLEGRTPQRVRANRALYCGLVFGIIGGGIALFVAGTGINGGYWAVEGLLAGACFAVLGGFIGYFAGRR